MGPPFLTVYVSSTRSLSIFCSNVTPGSPKTRRSLSLPSRLISTPRSRTSRNCVRRSRPKRWSPWATIFRRSCGELRPAYTPAYRTMGLCGRSAANRLLPPIGCETIRRRLQTDDGNATAIQPSNGTLHREVGLGQDDWMCRPERLADGTRP